MKVITLTVTVEKDEKDVVTEALMDALDGDFDVMYATSEREATPNEEQAFHEAFAQD